MDKIGQRLLEAETYFSRGKYKIATGLAIVAYKRGDHETASKHLESIPTRDDLFNTLVETLKGKPVYRTLRKIIEKKSISEFETLKGLFSLGTHISIECERGNREYAALLPSIYEQIGAMVFAL